jgi:serine/threonine protein kinase
MYDNRIGQQFGNYRLTRLLGEGGFAKVYLGEHLYVPSQVAIKLLHTKLISREQEEFLTEARTIATLDHPSIVRVLDCGIEHGESFLIMNYAPNGTVRQRYPKGSRLAFNIILVWFMLPEESKLRLVEALMAMADHVLNWFE